MAVIDTRWEALHAALRQLSAACDWAHERDARGFSSADAGIGHYLAQLEVADWVTEHAITAHTFVRKYRRQLAGHPAIELLNETLIPDAADLSEDEIGADVRRARDVALAGSQAARHRARIASESVVRVDGDRVALSFPYDEELIEEARAIAGRRYDGESRASVYPLTSLPDVLRFAERHDITVREEIRSLADAVAADPAAFQPVNIAISGDSFEINAPYSADLNTGLRQLNGGVSTWKAADRVHRIATNCNLAALKELAERHHLRAAADAAELLGEGGSTSVEPHVTLDGGALCVAATSGADVIAAVREASGSARVPIVDGQLRIGAHMAPATLLDTFTEAGLRLGHGVTETLTSIAAEQEVNRTSAIATAGAIRPIPGLAVDLFPHQAPAVDHIIRNRRVIVADDMGLGKTITALAAIAATDAFPAVIACKPDLVPNWHAEITRAIPGRRVYLAEGMTASDIPDDAEIVIIGFVALSANEERRAGDVHFTWVEKILDFHPRAFIVDEGHLGKESTAARSQAMALVGRAVAAIDDGVVLDLTGTPLVNRPRELAQQLVMLGYLAAKDEDATADHLFGEFGGFLYRYCGPIRNDWGWTFNGHSNLDELRDRLLAWGLFIRRDESAIELPPFAIRKIDLDPDQLDPTAMAEYRKAQTDLVSFVIDAAHAAAEARGVQVGPEIIDAVVNANKYEYLVRINALRQIIGRAKVPALTAWVADQISAGEKVMIAARHREVVASYADGFGGLTIRGGQSAAEKDADKRTFQTAPVEQAPAITVSIEAGGVGHTLTAARVGVQAELCWTPGELNQMAKRIHRIGQTRPVEYLVPLAVDTIDEDMWHKIDTKQAVLAAVLDGTPDDAESADAEADAAAAIACTLARRAITTV
ncbi:DEAD/DEAH box helicase family protein [Rhodococcus hoagii]|nr:DEAD/DEAH box helicase family protein [Prescottella equi]